jgi:ankyrin repeat protein
MTREEAIKLLVNATYSDEWQSNKDLTTAHHMAIKALEQEPKWIPVSERLPETNDDVLVTDGVDMFVAWCSRKNMWQEWMSSDNNFERNTPIIAWMPLPEPYREDGEE